MCVLFFLSNVCIPAYANVYFKTTIIKQNIKIILIAGVPSSQALPGYLITAPPSVCVPAVIGVLAVWIQNQKQKQKSPAQNTKHQFSMKTTLSKHKNNNNTTNNSNSHIHSQHTNTSLHN